MSIAYGAYIKGCRDVAKRGVAAVVEAMDVIAVDSLAGLAFLLAKTGHLIFGVQFFSFDWFR